MSKYKKVTFICFYDRMSLSIRALSSMLKRAGHQVQLLFLKDDRCVRIDEFQEHSDQYQMLYMGEFMGTGSDVRLPSEKEWSLLSGLVSDFGPDVIGISSRSAHTMLSIETVKRLRKKFPEVRFLAGGFGPTIDPKEYLAEFEFVCIGEGDHVIVPFVETDNPSSVPNIAYMKDGKLIFNKILDSAVLDELPIPDWDIKDNYMVEDECITSGADFYNAHTYDLFVSRGCPASCTYCMACQWGQMLKPYDKKFPKVRLRSIESVINELKWAMTHIRPTFIRFRDDIFGHSESWVMRFMDLYDKEIGLPFHCLLDERYSTKSIIQRLCDSGLGHTTVGIQSCNEGIRNKIFNRKISNDKIIEYAHNLKESGIRIQYDLLEWNPFETTETLMNGMEFLSKLPKSGNVALYQLKVFPGSELERIYKKSSLNSLTYDEFTYWALIHHMIVSSNESATKAFQLVENKNFDLEKCFKVYSEEVLDYSNRNKVFATENIEKGYKLTGSHIYIQESSKPGIPASELNNLMGQKTIHDVPKGKLLQWADFYGSYEGVRGRVPAK